MTSLVFDFKDIHARMLGDLKKPPKPVEEVKPPRAIGFAPALSAKYGQAPAPPWPPKRP